MDLGDNLSAEIDNLPPERSGENPLKAHYKWLGIQVRMKDLVLVASVTIFTILLWMMFSALAMGNSGSIRGQVSDFEGEPLSQAVVTVQGTDFNALTDTNGHFEISSLPPGSYYLIIENHFGGISIPVKIARGRAVELNEISLYSP
jgi:hypothetical protein